MCPSILHPSIHLFAHPSIHSSYLPSTHLFPLLSTRPSFHYPTSIPSSTHQPVDTIILPFVHLFIHPSFLDPSINHPSFHHPFALLQPSVIYPPSFHSFSLLSTSPSIHLFNHPSIPPLIYLSIIHPAFHSFIHLSSIFPVLSPSLSCIRHLSTRRSKLNNLLLSAEDPTVK